MRIKLSLMVAVVLSCLIISGSLYAIQDNKTNNYKGKEYSKSLNQKDTAIDIQYKFDCPKNRCNYKKKNTSNCAKKVDKDVELYFYLGGKLHYAGHGMTVNCAKKVSKKFKKRIKKYKKRKRIYKKRRVYKKRKVKRVKPKIEYYKLNGVTRAACPSVKHDVNSKK